MSIEFVKCTVCNAERESDTLDQSGRCPFCVDKPLPQITTVKSRKRVEKKVPQAEPVGAKTTPPPAQENAPIQKPIDLIPQDVLDIPYIPPTYTPATTVEQELALRELSRRSLLAFVQRFRPKYMAGWVHEDICRRLVRFMKDVALGKSPRMLLMMPPRSGKSELSSRHLPAYILGHHPDWEIIAASHTSSLSLSFSRYVRDLMRDPAYHAVFPNTRLDQSSQSIENWNTTQGGGYLAAGRGSGITGRGAHVLLLDDLVKDIEEADSDTISENTWEWYGSTAYTRLAPGGGVLGVMTWWSENDWAGRIQATMATGEGDAFEIVKYPAINEDGDEYILEKLPGQPIKEFLPGETIPEGARLTRRKRTALHPARYDTEAMLRIKRNLIATGQKRIWQSLYQQNPIPDDGLFFTKDMFRYYDTPPHHSLIKIYQAWDFAISEGKENDFTVGATIGHDAKDNIYVLDVRRFRSDDSIMIVDTILDYYEEYGALPVLGFEDGQIWKALQAFFERRCQERRLYPTFEILKPLTDKMVRAQPLRGRMQMKKVWFDKNAPWFTNLYNEFTRFPAGKHDDIIDATAWAVRLSLIFEKPREVDLTPKIKSWKEKLKASETGGISHMAA